MQRMAVLAVVCGCVVSQASAAVAAEGNISFAQDPTILDRQQDSAKPRLGVVTNSYYDFLINEGSYKFWAIFQLVTVAILLYSTFAAVYYAKYTFLKEIENSDVDDSLIRSTRSLHRRMFLGLDPATFQRIIDSVASLKTR